MNQAKPSIFIQYLAEAGGFRFEVLYFSRNILGFQISRLTSALVGISAINLAYSIAHETSLEEHQTSLTLTVNLALVGYYKNI